MGHQPQNTEPESPKRLDADPQLAIELAVCAEYRLSHSEFLSWVTSDRDKAIWQYARKRQACPGCGTRAEEWDPDAGGSWQAYRAETIQCEGCLKRHRAEEALEKSKSPPGMHVVLIKRVEEA